METKNLYEVKVTTVVGDLTYEEGQTYELTEAEVAAFAEGSIELVATPGETVDGEPAPETPAVDGAVEPEAPVAPEVGEQATAPEAPASEEAPAEEDKPWAGNHTVGRE